MRHLVMLLIGFLMCIGASAAWSQLESDSPRFRHVGRTLTRAGYAVLVPERRGYGKSDGEIWRKEVGSDQSRVISRLQAETDDMLAGIEYLRGLPYADTKRLAVMGWSFGGVVSMLAAARSTAFLAVVDQAGGALTWDGNSHMRSALIMAAEKSTTPTLFMVARNDRTTASVTTLADIFKEREHGFAVFFGAVRKEFIGERKVGTETVQRGRAAGLAGGAPACRRHVHTRHRWRDLRSDHGPDHPLVLRNRPARNGLRVGVTSSAPAAT